MARWSNPQDLVGETLEGRFRLERLLGEGGMGAVYEARHLRLDLRVAVKVLASQLAEDERQRKRFLREARAAVRIQHENVVQISDFGEEPTAYFVMEYLEGIDLADLLRSMGRVPWSRLRGLILPVVRALSAAHQLGIVHRDIKPSNVFVTRRDDGSEWVKVLDFGIAKVAQSGPETRGVTRTDEVLGTVAYMSPEQAVAHPVDARTDIYSLGILMFELLTGDIPFKGATQYQIIHQHINAELPSMRAVDPRIPPEVEAIVRQAAQKRPEHRFSTMEELRVALERVPESAVGDVDQRPAEPPHGALGATVVASAHGFGAPSAEVFDDVSERGAGRLPTDRPSVHPHLYDTQQDGVATGSNPPVRRAWPLWLGLGGGGVAAVGLVALVLGRGDAEPKPAPASLEPSVAPPSVASPTVERGAEGAVAAPEVAAVQPDAADEEGRSAEAEAAPDASVVTDAATPVPEAAPHLDAPPDPDDAPETPPEDPSETPEAADSASSKASTRTPTRKRTERAPKRRPTERGQPSDAALRAKIQASGSRCGVKTPTRLRFQIMPSGAVLLVQTNPSNACVESVVAGLKFAPRDRPESVRMKLTPS